LAFQEINITAKTPNPAQGSFYEKDKNGKLTGFISEVEAIRPFSKVAIKKFDIKNNVVKFFKGYAKNGITSITIIGMMPDKHPLKVSPDELRNIKVIKTIVNDVEIYN